MKVGMRVDGVKTVVTALRHTGEKVPENGRKRMHRMANRIVRDAKLNTPRETGALEDSIRIEKTYGRRGRLQIDIVAGGTSANRNGRIVNTEQYARMVHENYSSMKPGKGTIAKRNANPGRYIGEKFLERAMKDNRPQLLERLKEEIFGTIRKIFGVFK